MIKHYVDNLAQGRSKLCLATDGIAVAATSIACTNGDTRSGLLVCTVALLAWALTARALRQYDVWKGYQGHGRFSRFRPGEVLNDLTLTTVLVTAVASSVLMLHLVGGSRVSIDMGRFVGLLVPVALSLRLICIATVFWRFRERERVIIVGTGHLGRVTGEELRDRSMGCELVGYLVLAGDQQPTPGDQQPTPNQLPAPVLGAADRLSVYLESNAISEVYVAGSATRQGRAMQETIAVCENYGIPFALPAHDFRLHRARPVNGGALGDGYIHFVNYQPKPMQMSLKRLFDIVGSAVALWILAPLMIFVAIAIKLTSRGPVLFRQARVGIHGREFNMLKFRSMVANAELLKERLLDQNEQSGPVFKIAHDPRITTVGRWLRRFSIDELPQLVNVLRGDMSIVGPRPPLASEVSKYEPWQRRRLSVRPGLTCVWQVSGRNSVRFEDWMYLDMQYIDNWNLVRDFDLILKTVPVVLTGKGAS